MIERVVENWLINTNEIGYQIPFAQYLLSENYTILHLSSHGQMEQGKDIISLDNKNIPCAHQLKGGNIDLSEWRAIKGEIDALVEIPIHYPGIDKSIMHRAVLVTNGTITDPVRREIDDLNVTYKNRNFPQLELITQRDLLKRFLKFHHTFLPREPTDFKLFLDLVFSNERALIDKKLYTTFIESILFSEKETPIQLSRKIASGLLLNQYILAKYEKSQNHVALVEACTLFGSYMLALVEKHSLNEKYWKSSFDLVLRLITEGLESVKSEFLQRKNYLENSWDGGLLYRARLTMVIGWLSALELYYKQNDNTHVLDERIIQQIKTYRDSLWYWGESATGYFLMMSRLLDKSGDSQLSKHILIELIAKICVENQSDDGQGFPNPYYTVEQIMGVAYGLKEQALVSESFSLQSYHLEAIVDMLVRRNNRKELEELWKIISKILLLSEFKPSSKWIFLFWRTKKGEQVQRSYKNPQSWKELCDQVLDYSLPDLPNTLKKSSFSYFFLLVYPHRITRQSVKLIDRQE
ncbi:MAG: hypothetical protein LBB87_05970 [Nitrososphaerota archaeon]|nr:hypothetical protein [Nitrososphaerota archaeon]